MTDQDEQTKPLLLTCKDVAAMFGVGPQTVSRWARRNALPHFMTPGGRFRFRREEIERILEQSRGG